MFKLINSKLNTISEAETFGAGRLHSDTAPAGTGYRCMFTWQPISQEVPM